MRVSPALPNIYGRFSFSDGENATAAPACALSAFARSFLCRAGYKYHQKPHPPPRRSDGSETVPTVPPTGAPVRRSETMPTGSENLPRPICRQGDRRTRPASDLPTGSGTVKATGQPPTATGNRPRPICRQVTGRQVRNGHGFGRGNRAAGSGRSDLPRRSRGDLPTATGSETVPTATGETVPRPICRQSPPIVCRRSRAKRTATARRGVPAVRTGSRPSRSAAAPCGVPVRRGDGHGFGQSPRHLHRPCKGI